MPAVPSLLRLEGLRGGLSPRSSLPEAARVLVCLQVRMLEDRLPAALSGEEPAPLHDARVAGRRLRAGVAMFGSMYPRVWKKAGEAARCATSRFRLARDLDMRCARLRRMMMTGKGFSRKELGLIGMLLEGSLAERGALGIAGPPGGGIDGRMLLALWRPRISRAPQAERSLVVRLRELGQGAALLFPVACEEGRGGVQHRLRIRCRALRYSLEMMEWRLGDEAAWRLDILRNVQDELGGIHDIDVFRGYLAQKIGRSAPAGSGDYREMDRRLGEERRRHFRRFLDIGEELERALAPVIPWGPGRARP